MEPLGITIPLCTMSTDVFLEIMGATGYSLDMARVISYASVLNHILQEPYR